MKKIVFNCKDGTVNKVELTAEELAAMQSTIIWHNDSKNCRVVFPLDTYNANLQKLLAHNLGLESHPFLAALVLAVQTGAFIRVDADGMVYYYCDEVYNDDKIIIESYGGYVEPKVMCL